MKSFTPTVGNAYIFTAMATLVGLAAASPAWAQKDMGSIVGVVKDGAGAVVTDAKVDVTDVDRGTVFPTKTNSTGEFVAGPLKTGGYTVTVEKKGFKKAVAGPITLNVQDRIALDVTLEVGTVTETTIVSTTAALLETETSELGQVVSSRTATTLPLNGRNFAQLAQLSVGVAPSEPGSRTEPRFSFSSNGARALQNNFLLDGVDHNTNLRDLFYVTA